MGGVPPAPRVRTRVPARGRRLEAARERGKLLDGASTSGKTPVTFHGGTGRRRARQENRNANREPHQAKPLKPLVRARWQKNESGFLTCGKPGQRRGRVGEQDQALMRCFRTSRRLLSNKLVVKDQMSASPLRRGFGATFKPSDRGSVHHSRSQICWTTGFSVTCQAWSRTGFHSLA